MQCITPVVGSCDEPHVVEHVVDPSPRPRYPCPPSQSSSSPSPRLVVDLEGEADELEGEDEDGGVGVGRGLRQPQGGGHRGGDSQAQHDGHLSGHQVQPLVHRWCNTKPLQNSTIQPLPPETRDQESIPYFLYGCGTALTTGSNPILPSRIAT